MAKFVCSICGYPHEGNEAPGRCPVCKSPSTQFMLMEDPDQEGVKDVEYTAKEKEHSCIGDTCSTEQEQVKEQEDSVDTVEKDNKDEEKLSNILDNALCSEEDELEILKNRTAILQAVKWYKDKHNCSLKEAKDVVDYVYEKHSVVAGNIIDDEEDNKKKLKENIKYSIIGSIIVFVILHFTGFTSILGIIIEIVWTLAVIGMLSKDENGKYV